MKRLSFRRVSVRIRGPGSRIVFQETSIGQSVLVVNNLKVRLYSGNFFLFYPVPQSLTDLPPSTKSLLQRGPLVTSSPHVLRLRPWDTSKPLLIRSTSFTVRVSTLTQTSQVPRRSGHTDLSTYSLR